MKNQHHTTGPFFNRGAEDRGESPFFDSAFSEEDNFSTLELTSLLNSGVKEALSSLTPEQLQELEQSVYQLDQTQKTPPKKKKNRGSGSKSRRKKTSGGQYLNLPASTPIFERSNGTQWMGFTYSTRGHVQEYKVLVEGADAVPLDVIPLKFKEDNCVYPSAMHPYEKYKGNRWEYETTVNELSWRLCWLNPTILCGKRGLIQRAVDSYRNRKSESRSRRVIRQERLSSGAVRTRTEGTVDESGKTMLLQWMERGRLLKIRLRIDIENVDLDSLPHDFRQRNCLYVNAVSAHEQLYADSHAQKEFEKTSNELGWALACLNEARLDGKRNLIQKAVEAYRMRSTGKTSKIRAVTNEAQKPPFDQQFDYYADEKGTQAEELREMVESTLQQAMEDGLDVGFAQGLDDATILAVLQQAQLQLNKEDEY